MSFGPTPWRGVIISRHRLECAELGGLSEERCFLFVNVREEFLVLDWGFRVQGFGIWGSWLREWGSWSRVHATEEESALFRDHVREKCFVLFRVSDPGFRVSRLDFLMFSILVYVSDPREHVFVFFWFWSWQLHPSGRPRRARLRRHFLSGRALLGIRSPFLSGRARFGIG